MTEKEIKERVRKYLGQHTSVTGLRDDEDLFTEGFVNSLQALELTQQVERGFGITIRQTEVKDLRTVDTITRFILHKLA